MNLRLTILASVISGCVVVLGGFFQMFGWPGGSNLLITGLILIVLCVLLMVMQLGETADSSRRYK